MNEPLRLKECEKDPSYCKFGVEALANLLKALEAQIGGVIESEDIEYIHKMRVASRRIRAVMPLFEACFPRKKFKKWLQEIRKVTRLLGEARDFDVQIAFIQQYIEKIDFPAENTGIEFLLIKHKDRRISIQPKVVEGLNDLKNSRVLFYMTEFCTQKIDELAKTTFCAHVVLNQGCVHISSKLNSFLCMEEYVKQETEILKHHEMRIKAKWLRYTMEAFSPLYNGKLKNEIEVIKDFQDVLGEMHDCDVWIEYIPKFVAETKSEFGNTNNEEQQSLEIENAMSTFLTYVKERRKTNYAYFVQLWEKTKESKVFENLRGTINTEFLMDEQIAKSISTPDAKIAIVADIHANLHALESVVQDAEKRGATVFLNAGDSVGYGPFPFEVLRLLHSKNVKSVLGNFDLEVMENTFKGDALKRITLEFTKEELTEQNGFCLLFYPKEIRLEVAGRKLLIVHGSPQSIDEHIYRDTSIKRLEALAEMAKADIVIVGHSHEQFHREVNGVLFINPGSVGRPGDGNPQTAYAIASFNPFLIEMFRLDYNVAAAAGELRKKGLPESFAQMLLRGLSLDAIVSEDLARKDDVVKDYEEIVAVSQKVSKSFLPDTEHCEQVRKLVLSFYDSLESLHCLGKRERIWLECAAILHDVGLSEGRGGHHKKSMKLILNNTELPFPSEEKQIIASIARYHRKGLPKEKHSNLATLNRAVAKKIMILASLLRLADSLDYCHESIVKSVNVEVGPGRVAIEAFVNSVAILEEQAFNRKKDLFENVFKIKLVLVWKVQ